MAKRHYESTAIDAGNDGAAGEDMPIPDTAHANTDPPVASEEVGDGTAETEGSKREIRSFTPDEAYRRIANILKRTPKEARVNVLAAATAVAALG